MSVAPWRVFLDTNVYIIAAAEPSSNEAAIIQWICDRAYSSNIQVIISQILLSEISRVAIRLRHKDWAGKILNDIWTTLNPSSSDDCSQRISTIASQWYFAKGGYWRLPNG